MSEWKLLNEWAETVQSSDPGIADWSGSSRCDYRPRSTAEVIDWPADVASCVRWMTERPQCHSSVSSTVYNWKCCSASCPALVLLALEEACNAISTV